MNRLASRLPAIVEQQQAEILADWVKSQLESGSWRAGRLQESQLREESQRFLTLLAATLKNSMSFDPRSTQWSEIREFLAGLSRSRAAQGFSPTQVATFVFSLKQPLFARLRKSLGGETDVLADTMWETTALLDALGLHTTELYQQA